MKKLIGLFVLLAALLLGAYLGMGVLTERTLKKNLSVVNQSNGVKVALSEYHRGWFTSQAVINWTLIIPERIILEGGQRVILPQKNYALSMPLSIHHGPIMITSKGLQVGFGAASTDLTLPDSYRLEFEKLYTKNSQQPHLMLSVFVNLLNKMEARLEIPAFHLFLKKGHQQFDWLGLKSDVAVSSKSNHVNGRLTLVGLHFVKEDMQMLIGAIQSEYDLHQTPMGLYMGDAHFSLPSVLVTEKGHQKLSIEQFHFDSKSDIVSGLLQSQLTAELDRLILNGEQYGPGQLIGSIKNLDAEVLLNINNEIASLQQASISDRQQWFFKLLPQLPDLLNKGAELNISTLKLKMPKGDLSGHLLIGLPKDNIVNPFQLLQKANGDLLLTMSKPVLEEIVQDILQHSVAPIAVNNVPTASPTMPTVDPVSEGHAKISRMLKTGVLSIKNDNYVLNVTWNNGQLKVNGAPFNSSMMLL